MWLVVLYPAAFIAEGEVLIRFRLVIGFVTVAVLIAVLPGRDSDVFRYPGARSEQIIY